jgi:hypothetical protein
MAADAGGAWGGVYKKLASRKKPAGGGRRGWGWKGKKGGLSIEEKYRRRKRPSGSWGGGGYTGGGGGGAAGGRVPKPPRKPAWWGEEWFGEGRAVEIKGLGTTNLRDMRHFQNIDPLWRSWLEQLVQQSGSQGWWGDPQQSPLQWMAPIWSQM